MSTSALESPRNLIDELLAEQQRLTAVERFARKHEQHELPAQARYYKSLIPLSKPGPGEQYAFAVDLDVCTACKACVAACHSLNGLDEDEIWRNCGTIYGGQLDSAYQQTVTTACHHCVEPGCLEGCPVMAYEKDEVTGIVRHLDDQCIGCEYCLLKCPYDVPKYSSRRGIVRKCDMCYHRLAADEAPACVQACPNEAITIRLVQKAAAVAKAAPGVRLLPGAFESSYTKPTTEYRTRHHMPVNAQPADIYHLRLEHPHWPLIWMLLFTQLSAGLSVALGLAAFLPGFATVRQPLALGAFVALQAGLAVSVFHLGQPLKAWRFFLGLRTSWMSREILAFSLFAGASAAATAACCFPLISGLFPWLSGFAPLADRWAPALSLGAAATALIGVYCSAMIYVDTYRSAWRASVTFTRFFGTAAVLGTTGAATLLSLLPVHDTSVRLAAAGAAYALTFYAFVETRSFLTSLRDPAALSHRATLTAWRLLHAIVQTRAAFTIAALLCITLAAATADLAQTVLAALAFVTLFAGSLLERFCFFTASDAPRMPGGITA